MAYAWLRQCFAYRLIKDAF